MNCTKLLQQLIQIPSFSGNEEKLAAFIGQWAKKHGLPVEKQEGNVVIRLKGKSRNKAMIFNAHMDTVSKGVAKLWKYPPYGKQSGVIKAGKIYGLGASDDKASIAAFLEVAMQLKAVPPNADVFIVFVTNEETDGSGSKSFVNYFQKKYAGRYDEVSAIIGEPTDLTAIEIGHRGNVFIKVTTYGDAGHGAQPEKIRKHSIYKQIQVIGTIKKMAKKWAQKYKDSVLGKPSFCLTSVQSDPSSVNKVPAGCSSTWDIRTTPALHSEVVSLLQNELGECCKIEYVCTPASFGLTSPESKIVKLFQKLLPDIGINISPGSNDICVFQAGGIPAITFGPGNKHAIHKADEFVEVDKVNKSIPVYLKVIQAYSL
mgnify:CR=1 FL=1